MQEDWWQVHDWTEEGYRRIWYYKNWNKQITNKRLPVINKKLHTDKQAIITDTSHYNNKHPLEM